MSLLSTTFSTYMVLSLLLPKYCAFPWWTKRTCFFSFSFLLFIFHHMTARCCLIINSVIRVLGFLSHSTQEVFDISTCFTTSHTHTHMQTYTSTNWLLRLALQFSLAASHLPAVFCYNCSRTRVAYCFSHFFRLNSCLFHTIFLCLSIIFLFFLSFVLLCHGSWLLLLFYREDEWVASFWYLWEWKAISNINT